jgi:hypothetical protein
LLEGGLVVRHVARLGRSVLSDVEHDDEEDAADYGMSARPKPMEMLPHETPYAPG